MKINWAKRFENKTFVISFATILVGFVYQIISLFGIVPAVSENEVMQLIVLVVNILAGLGILVDPTTAGMSDSARVLYGAEYNAEPAMDMATEAADLLNKKSETPNKGGDGGEV